jgi:hypothetical protein
VNEEDAVHAEREALNNYMQKKKYAENYPPEAQATWNTNCIVTMIRRNAW